MRTLRIPYATWDLVVTDNAYRVYHIVDGTDVRHAYAGTREIVFTTEIDADTWSMYQPKYEATAVVIANEDDALAQIIGLTRPGKQRMIIDVFPSGFVEYITGAFDDVANGVVGNGTGMRMSSDGASGDVSLTGAFVDQIGLIKGTAFYQNFMPGDWVSCEVFAPATAVVPNGTNTGNADIVNSVVIVPAAGNGAYDVDLTTANLVPASGAGYWDWDNATTGRGVITPSVTPGLAGWHLLAIQQDLNHFVHKAGGLGSGNVFYGVEVLEPKTLLPHWTHKFVLHVNTTTPHTADLEIHMIMARKRTF